MQLTVKQKNHLGAVVLANNADHHEISGKCKFLKFQILNSFIFHDFQLLKILENLISSSRVVS